MKIFYFRDDGELDMYYILKIRHPIIKNSQSVTFVECTEMNWKTLDVNGFYISIFLNKMGWYLNVIEKLHNDEF